MYYRDNAMAASGYGHGGGECYCGNENGINDIVALAAGAIGAFLLYQAITMAAAGRKKRDDGSLTPASEVVKDILYAGKTPSTVVNYSCEVVM